MSANNDQPIEDLLSAMIIVHNGERYLGEAIESALAQSGVELEVLVVDNASTDGSRAVAEGFGDPIRVVSEPNLGIGFARNRALAEARGQYFAFLDADDTWEPYKTSIQVEALNGASNPDCVFGHVQQFLSPDADPAIKEKFVVPDQPQPGRILTTMLATADTFARVGPLESGVTTSDGLEWLLRARRLDLQGMMLDEVVTVRRIHGSNHSIENRNDRSGFIRLIKAELDARRAGK